MRTMGRAVPVCHGAPVEPHAHAHPLPPAQVPVDIGYLLALQWLFDRLNAVTNVVTDTVVAKIVDATTDVKSEMRKAQQQRQRRQNMAAASGAHGAHQSKTTRRSLWSSDEAPAATPAASPAAGVGEAHPQGEGAPPSVALLDVDLLLRGSKAATPPTQAAAVENPLAGLGGGGGGGRHVAVSVADMPV